MFGVISDVWAYRLLREARSGSENDAAIPVGRRQGNPVEPHSEQPSNADTNDAHPRDRLGRSVEPDAAVDVAGLDDVAVHGAGNLVRHPVRSHTRTGLAAAGIVHRRLPQCRPHGDAYRGDPGHSRDQRRNGHGPSLAHQNERHGHDNNGHASTEKSHPPSGHLFMMPSTVAFPSAKARQSRLRAGTLRLLSACSPASWELL